MLTDASANDFAGTEKLDRMVVPGTTVKVALIVLSDKRSSVVEVSEPIPSERVHFFLHTKEIGM